MKTTRFLTFIFLSVISSLSIAADIWIDVRSEKEFKSGHFQAAIHIPHTDVADRINTVTSNKKDTIHLYCKSGGRAEIAKTALEKLGYTNVINEGGYADVLENYPQ